ncbi:hypothetical protein HPB50_028196 [Hyalomma asiaticum]|nr:hypothetical protein HPB50_028196 [Hyalomma asiaticum]
MASKGGGNVRTRFTASDDISLLREVIATEAVSDCSKWPEVAARLSYAAKVAGQAKKFTARAVRDRFDLLLSQFSAADEANLRKSGTEEEYTEKEQLLTELLQLVREVGYKFKMRKNVAAQTERQSAIEARDAASATYAATTEDDAQRGVSMAANLLEEIYCNPEEIEWIDLEETETSNEVSAGSPEETPQAETEAAVTPEQPRQQVARRRRGQSQSADHAFLEKRWKHEQALKDKDIAIEEKRIGLERSRLALERKRLQREYQLRMEELRVREEERRERAEQRRTNATQQSALLEIVNKLFDALKKD